VFVHASLDDAGTIEAMQEARLALLALASTKCAVQSKAEKNQPNSLR